MAFDANGIVCTDINKASFQLIPDDEVEKTAVCQVYSAVVSDGEVPRYGGVHDPRMGPMDSEPRRGDASCVTCGGRDDCPGHLGFIRLALPAFHPLFIGTLIRLLKGCCLICRRLKLDSGSATMYLKRFQMVQMGELGLLEQFEQLSSVKGGGRGRGADTSLMERKIEMRKILMQMKQRELLVRQTDSGRLRDMCNDISATASNIENWRLLTRDLWDKADRALCSHCGRKFTRAIRKKDLESRIEVSWNFEGECPVERAVLLKTLDRQEELAANNNDASIATVRDAEGVAGVDDEAVRRDHRSLGRRGKSMGSVCLQAYQTLPIIRDIFNSPDRPLLEFLIPASMKHGYKFFFMNNVPVSANKFRPKAKSLGFGQSAQPNKGGADDAGGILHPRSAALIDILNENAKVAFALSALRHGDPIAHLSNQEGGLAANVPANVMWRDKERLGKAVTEHKGNYALLHQYCRQLQEKINCYIDSTKTTTRNPPPAVRQWMEKKNGAIRQKMMGKRVNFAARTTIAPDAQINTNEIGIPMPFAMKLSIPENAVPHNVDLLCRLVMNGPKVYPGCNAITEPSGRKLDLTRRPMSEAQKKMQCKQIRNYVEQQVTNGGLTNPKMCRPYTVFRHLRDGDVVMMNRQPSLHRASMMAHFVRVLTGQKTFRLNYANCGSYNADFDGDEMNMHCLQDYTARAEAAFICNSDCNYTVAKSGEPLRGLIQDHVLGGNFLTVRGTFLTKDQYYHLIYVGVAAFVDKGERFSVDASKLVVPEFSAGDPFARALGSRNIRVVTDPPTIWKPQALWTGKQVVTAVMKTLIDSIALIEFGKNGDGSPNEQFLKNYKGINLISKAKTAGDAWNGVLDKDMEEQKVVIRHSELLQGVFDKSQFGASSYGLVHLSYELLGPRMAGTLLSVFSRICSCYLQMRGFSCSSGDFMMTPEGESARDKMIMRCTAAGTYLQEAFVDVIYKHMHWQEKITNTHGVKSKYVHVGRALSDAFAVHANETGRLSKKHIDASYDEFAKQQTDDKRITQMGLPNRDAQNVRIKNTQVPPFWPADPAKPAAAQSPWLTAEQRRLFQSGAELDIVDQKVRTQEEVEAVIPAKSADIASTWNASRHMHTPVPVSDWRRRDAAVCLEELKKEVKAMRSLGADNERVRKAILEQLTAMPEIALYFPRLAKVLGVEKLWGNVSVRDRIAMATASRSLGIAPPPAPVGRMGPPLANKAHLLPSGLVVQGDGSLRVPKMYHPSWVWTGKEEELPFESPLRYISRILQVDEHKRMDEHSSAQRLFMVMPSELTRMRMERLAVDYFAGREDLFITMFDKFFQANMGKLSSKNNDLVSGDVTLYPFPRNGFSSMVTTGAKGSKVNFAMICGMLSQQSLEGKRVPLMISGKTHPAFGAWDLGARAGGLITDRYLTGLRPPDYFFHCMAGREGLVDTAVKTARSGYLQRCVIKSLEGMVVSYDGSVREGDGSVIQFLYGEDGADVCKMTYLHNLKDLMANPVLAQAKFASRFKLENKQLKARMQAVEQADIERHLSGLTEEELDPMTKLFPPCHFPGSVSEFFRDTAIKQINTTLAKEPLILKDLLDLNIIKKRHVKEGQLWARKDGSMSNLSKIMRLKFRQSLAEPGDAVGCLAAQSMGEPATQMTLNTFHLAGHGAANVTLGIPRLREILQTAGDSSTPVLYIPVKGEEKAEYSANAHKLMLGFRKIKLSDVVNAVGVEANVYAQPENRASTNAGNPEYNRGLYDLNPRFGDGVVKKYWGYECTIQFENLEHFCKVVPKYTPQKIVNFTINRVVKNLMKIVNKMMAIHATKAADEVWDSSDDELSFAMERYLLDRNFRGMLDKKRAQKETLKAAGLGFGLAATDRGEGGDDAADLEVLTSGVPGNVFRKGNKKKVDEDGDEEVEVEEEDGALPDSDESKDDSEEGLSDPEGQDVEAPLPDSDTEEKAPVAEAMVDSDGEAESDVEKIKRLTRREKKETATQFPSLDKWKYDQKRRVLMKTNPLEDGLNPDLLEDEALWSEGEAAAFRSKGLPDEAFRYMTDLKVCNKTWRITVKWGWPVERCPRKIEFLPPCVRLIQKQVLQATPGVANPHVVGKGDTTTPKKIGSKERVECEIQCEGCNLAWVAQLSDQCVDHAKVTTNDIRAMFKYYGVECGRACIVGELARVFAVYGITVDFRHLSLIADAMTSSGEFRAFSRLGMSHHSSPLLQMSFETSIKFLTEGVERGAIDNLRCPSGAIVVGRNTSVGTGVCRPLTALAMKLRA